jgi:hypothetical protein
VPRMTCAVELDDRAAHRVAQDDRSDDAHGVAEGADVVGARLEVHSAGSPHSDRPWPRKSR